MLSKREALVYHSQTMKNLPRFFIFLFCLFVLSGCARLGTQFITPYRLEIQQGNFVSKEMLAQLKLGMSREQVRFILGTPMHSSIFHANRWDYVFYLSRVDRKVEQRLFSVFFENEKLARLEGGEDLPSERVREMPVKETSPKETPAKETSTQETVKKEVMPTASAPAANAAAPQDVVPGSVEPLQDKSSAPAAGEAVSPIQFERPSTTSNEKP